MINDRITLIVSDLHVGGGPSDPGDDHIFQTQELVRLLAEWSVTPEGLVGRLELIFNGDFLEFAQVNQSAFTHVSDSYWCTEAESVAKLETIISGHTDIFTALARFQASGCWCRRLTDPGCRFGVPLQDAHTNVAGCGMAHSKEGQLKIGPWVKFESASTVHSQYGLCASFA